VSSLTSNGGASATRFSRLPANPNRETFSIPAIARLLDRYITANMVVVDPFSPNSNWGTITNDLNPNTRARYHMDCEAFLDQLLGYNLRIDLTLLDPTYSAEQVRRTYQSIGLSKWDAERTFLTRCKDRIATLTKRNGLVISFGYNSNGIGRSRGFDVIEIMLLFFGGNRNDIIVTVERKV
jgi:hypothetical protein